MSVLRSVAFGTMLAIAGCTHAPIDRAAVPAAPLVYVGTHGEKPGQELFGGRFDEATGALSEFRSVADVFRPTWVAADPSAPVLFAVSESGNDGKSQAKLFSFAVDRASGDLALLSQVDSGGGGATHLAYDPRSHALFAANFGSGSASVAPVATDGRLGPVGSVMQNVGTGPHRRQKSPHAHGVTLDPSGNWLLVPDLGADRVFVYAFDPQARTLAPAATPFAQVPPGSGPRHLVFGADGRFAYLITELTAQVMVFRWDPRAGRLDSVETLDLLPGDFQGDRSAAELAVSADGRFLYVSTREGDNSVVVFAIDPRSGRLAEVQRVAVGRRPWSFALSPGGHWLLVAQEVEDRITLFARDRKSGRLTATGRSAAVPKPVSLAFVP